MKTNWICGHCGEENKEHDSDCTQCGWEKRIVCSGYNPYFRIGQLEGAIKGALPYFEALLELVEDNIPAHKKDGLAAHAIIANLKQLIGEKE